MRSYVRNFFVQCLGSQSLKHPNIPQKCLSDQILKDNTRRCSTLQSMIYSSPHCHEMHYIFNNHHSSVILSICIPPNIQNVIDIPSEYSALAPPKCRGTETTATTDGSGITSTTSGAAFSWCLSYSMTPKSLTLIIFVHFKLISSVSKLHFVKIQQIKYLN